MVRINVSQQEYDIIKAYRNGKLLGYRIDTSLPKNDLLKLLRKNSKKLFNKNTLLRQIEIDGHVLNYVTEKTKNKQRLLLYRYRQNPKINIVINEKTGNIKKINSRDDWGKQ